MAKKKLSAKEKLKKAIEGWSEERCAEVLRYIDLRDHPPKPSRKKSDDPDDEDDQEERFIDPK